MLTPQKVKEIQSSPKFQKLTSERSRFAMKLTVSVLVIYYGFVLLIAFAKEVLGMPLGNSVITLGIVVGLGIIILSFILTGVYVRRANSEFDQLVKEIKDDAKANA